MSDKQMQVVVDKDIDDYLDFANNCALQALGSPSLIMDLVRDVDSLIREVWSGPIEADAIPMFLGMNGYYLLLAAIRMALAGHVASIFPLARSALESSCYAFLLSKDVSLVPIWTNRENGEAGRKACRRAFANAVSETTRRLRVSQVEAAEYIQGLYDSSITYGAHPNPTGLFVHFDLPSDGGDQWKVPFNCMYDSTSYQMAHGLFVCAEFGIGIAYLNAQCISNHPRREQLQARFDAVNQSKNLMEDRMKDGSWKGSL